jgi:hypothetical protein
MERNAKVREPQSDCISWDRRGKAQRRLRLSAFNGTAVAQPGRAMVALAQPDKRLRIPIAKQG